MATETRKIYQAITAIMKEVDAIGKDQQNQQQHFKFRGIDDVYNALHPLMAKHQVFSTPEVITKESSFETTKHGTKLFYEKLTIKYTFYTTDGSSVSATVCGVGMDSGDKAANKAMAIGHKYALLQVFCIPTQDMQDPDGETPSESQAPANGTQRAPSEPRSQAQPTQRTPPAQRPASGQQRRPQQQNRGSAGTVPSTSQVNTALKCNTMTDQERAKKELIISKYIKELADHIQRQGITPEKWKEWLKECYGYESIYHIKVDAYAGILKTVIEHPEQIKDFKPREAAQEQPPVEDENLPF